MRIKERKEITGIHNKEEFKYEDGIVSVFGRRWNKKDIKTLVEIANLLELQGYKLKKFTKYRGNTEYLAGLNALSSLIKQSGADDDENEEKDEENS